MTKSEILQSAKPILFNTTMVQAILGGRKTVTRRVIKPRYRDDEYGFNVVTNESTGERWIEKYDEDEGDFEQTRYVNPQYQVGDILYVRETWSPVFVRPKRYLYKVSCNETPSNTPINWHPSIHMPKEAARIFLRVTEVRVERLQDITSEQAKNEGVDLTSGTPFPKSVARDCHGAADELSTYQSKFVILWDGTINKQDLDEYGWNANPWVWVYEFERVVCDE